MMISTHSYNKSTTCYWVSVTLLCTGNMYTVKHVSRVISKDVIIIEAISINLRCWPLQATGNQHVSTTYSRPAFMHRNRLWSLLWYICYTITRNKKPTFWIYTLCTQIVHLTLQSLHSVMSSYHLRIYNSYQIITDAISLTAPGYLMITLQ